MAQFINIVAGQHYYVNDFHATNFTFRFMDKGV